MSSKELLRSKRAEILSIAEKYGASNLRLFGSVLRGDDNPESDIDIIVVLEAGRTLLDLVALEQDLTELIGRQIDVVVEGGISKHIEPHILREASGF